MKGRANRQKTVSEQVRAPAARVTRDASRRDRPAREKQAGPRRPKH